MSNEIIKQDNAVVAGGGEKEKQKDEILQLVTFSVGEEEFGVEILKVQEINKMLQVTKIPNSPNIVS